MKNKIEKSIKKIIKTIFPKRKLRGFNVIEYGGVPEGELWFIDKNKFYKYREK